MNDELKKKLMGLINRPEHTNLTDIQDENIDDALGQKIEDPSQDGEMEVSPEGQAGDEEMEASPELGAQDKPDEYKADPKMMEMLKRLKSGQPAEEVEVQPETINDTSAPMEMRKAAIEKIKQKYLGR